MLRWTTALLAGMLFGLADLSAQSPSAADFRPMEALVGTCWIGTFPDGKRTDEHCFEWVFDRKFIRDRHVVRGGPSYQGETLYGWDVEARKLSWWYWSSDGMMMVGRVEYTPDGIVFPSRFSTPGGEVEIKAVWDRVGKDGYRVAQSQKTATGWTSLWTMEMSRKP